MDQLILLGIISLATVSNFIFIKFKLDTERYADVFVDLVVLATLSSLFAGTMAGMVIAMCASAMMSVYLYLSPPKFLSSL